MCEYCGCQEVEVIAELTAEHDRLRELGRELYAAARADELVRARELATAMRAVLRPHTAVEEAGLFRAMAGDFGDHVATLAVEHRVIDHVLAELADGLPVAPGWPGRVAAALRQLLEHILKEQDGLFPAALATLSADEWAEIEEVRRIVGTELSVLR